MKDSQLDRMSLRELRDLQAQINELIPRKQREEREELRQRMEQMAREAGHDVSELFGRGRGNGRRKGSKVAPKYRNPKNASQTWSGRGRRPKWMTEAGGDPKRFLIS